MEVEPNEAESGSTDESPYYSGESSISYSTKTEPNEICSCCHSPNTILTLSDWNCPLVELENAAKDDCPQCQHLYRLIKVFAPDAFQGSNTVDMYPSFHCKLWIHSGVRARKEAYELDIFCLHKVNLGGKLLEEVPVIDLELDTGSQKTLDSITGWIKECDSEHTTCQATTASGQFQGPKRILDLRSGIARLREDLPEEYSYACLSHCWGNADTVPKTVAATIELFKENIPTDILTKTFRDAIDLCRRLDIHFLWIDSLCIKQDDDEDWKNEAPRMAGIYESAILTIAATMSADGSGGLYAKSKHPIYTSSDDLSIRETNPKFPTSPYDSLEHWPLLKRGWVFQERLLSRRILHFGAEEVIWECKTHRPSEDWIFHQTVAPTVAEALPSTWRSHVKDYTRLELTLDTDKLVALSGIAEKVAMLRPDDSYIAGLWKKTLLQDLTWTASRYASDLLARPSNFIAPTWSWASIKTCVDFQYGGSYSVLRGIKVIDVSCPTTYTGHVRREGIESLRPTITIRGPLLAAKLTTKDPLHLYSKEDPARSYYYYVEVMAEFMTEFKSLNSVKWGTFYPDYLFHMPGKHYVAPDSELFVLPIFTYSSGAEFLLLRELDGTLFFERLGYLKINHQISRSPKMVLRTGLYSVPFSNVTIV